MQVVDTGARLLELRWIERQREPVIGDTCVNSPFEAEPPHDSFNLA